MMRKRTWVLLITVLCAAAGCNGGDDTNNNGNVAGTGSSGSGGSTAGTGAAGMSGGDSGMGGGGTAGGGDIAGCIVRDEINGDCPQIEPISGDCAPRGVCCHRSSNIAKEEMLGPNDPLEIEYRVNYSATRNHPTTIGVNFLTQSATTRYEQEQQSSMWRFIVPRENGMQVSGMGKAQIGVGRYNCGEGTYSFYNDTAAPARPGVTEDRARWIAEEVDTMVDVSTSGPDRIKIAFADNANRGLTWTPFLDNMGEALDWELIHSGFTIEDINFENLDCQGERSGSQWTAGGNFVIYTPMADNDSQIITLIQQTYCALVAFGILPDGMKEKKCVETPRCVPDGGMFGDGGCDWEKLPDSLCPTTDAERALFGCHLGDPNNVNQEQGYPSAEEINCTMEAPTSPADPDMGSPGQCCDPMGEDPMLPACNAYRLIQDYVAGAVEITDDLKGEVQPDCLP